MKTSRKVWIILLIVMGAGIITLLFSPKRKRTVTEEHSKVRISGSITNTIWITTNKSPVITINPPGSVGQYRIAIIVVGDDVPFTQYFNELDDDSMVEVIPPTKDWPSKNFTPKFHSNELTTVSFKLSDKAPMKRARIKYIIAPVR